MIQTSLIGYGRFYLEQFHAGEHFARFDGSIGMVDPRSPRSGDHIPVWIDLGTSNARKRLFHRHAIVHAVTRDQARLVSIRTRKTKGDR